MAESNSTAIPPFLSKGSPFDELACKGLENQKPKQVEVNAKPHWH
jgi:hypothetical protein